MVYIPNTDKDRAEMFDFIGVKDFEELISYIPPSLRVKGEINLPPALSEFEAIKHLKELSNKNISGTTHANFIGGGAYDHYTPVLVDHIISRPEFYTAYTPYQAELSQGTLQAMYEFQTCVSMLSGLDIANASMYDGSSALAEAVIMAVNVSRKGKVLLAGTLHPDYKSVIKSFTQGQDVVIEEIKTNDGCIDLADLKEKMSDDIAAVVVQHPNFFGNLEEVHEINELISKYPKAQFVVSYYPISVGLLQSPGEYGADIATADGQSLGVPLSFGGPYIGLFATKQKNVRKMPGRMSGQTIDKDGNEGFVLTLQTREQHIKRERATSNICTNQGLIAVAVLGYLSIMGKEGLVEVAKHTYNKAHYLASKVKEIPGFDLMYDKEFFNEFVIKSDKNTELLLDKLQENNIFGGLNLERYGHDGLLVAVTEKRTREELDQYIETLKSI